MAELKLQAGAVGYGLRSYGDIIFNTDGAYDIGKSGATRPRNIFFTGTITGGAASFTTGAFSGNVTLGGNATPSLLFTPTSGSTRIAKWQQSADVLYLADSGVANRVSIDLPTGNVSILTGSLTAGAISGTTGAFTKTSGVGYVLSGVGVSTAGSSYGLSIDAGTNASDYAVLIRNQAGSQTLMSIKGDGAFFVNGVASFGSSLSAGAISGTTIGASGLISGTKTTGIQAQFAGYCPQGAATSANAGSIVVGSAAATYYGLIQFSAAGNTALYIENTFDDAAGSMIFRMRGLGTPVNALTILGTGAATFASTVAVTGDATIGTGVADAFLKIDTAASGNKNAAVLFGKTASYRFGLGIDGTTDIFSVGKMISAIAWTPYLSIAYATGAISLYAQPAFVAGSKYLVIDASGNVQVSALGPAS